VPRPNVTPCYNGEFVLESVLSLLAAIRVFFRSRSDTALEVLALRQQVAVLKRKRPRPHLNSLDRLFWTILLQLWSRWAEVLVIVRSKTVVGWHRAGFRWYWRWRSRPRGGRRSRCRDRELDFHLDPILYTHCMQAKPGALRLIGELRTVA
jgi:hypothetical protein